MSETGADQRSRLETPARQPDEPVAVEGPVSGRLGRIALIVIALIALALFTWLTINVILVIFAGILLAVLLHGMSRWLSERTPLPPRPALGAVVVGLITAIGGSVWLAAAQVASHVDEIVATLPARLEEAERTVAAQWWGPWVLENVPHTETWLGAQDLALSSLAEGASTVMQVVTAVVLVLFFGLFLATNPSVYLRGALYLAPRQRRSRLAEAAEAVGEALETYLLTKIVSMLAAGLIATIGLWLLDVPLSVSLGVLTGLLFFVPIVGPLIAMTLAVAMALLDGPLTALAVLGLYLGIQALDGYLLKPLVYRRALDFPPALTLGAQVLMGVLVGGLGVALASPLALTLWVLVRMLYVEDVLNEPSFDESNSSSASPTTAAESRPVV